MDIHSREHDDPIAVARIAISELVFEITLELVLLALVIAGGLSIFRAASMNGLLIACGCICIVVIILCGWTWCILRSPLRVTIWADGIELRRLFTCTWISANQIGRIDASATRRPGVKSMVRHIQLYDVDKRLLFRAFETSYHCSSAPLYDVLCSTFAGCPADGCSRRHDS